MTRASSSSGARHGWWIRASRETLSPCSNCRQPKGGSVRVPRRWGLVEVGGFRLLGEQGALAQAPRQTAHAQAVKQIPAAVEELCGSGGG